MVYWCPATKNLISYAGQSKKPAASSLEEDCVVDRLLAEIRQGTFKLRKTQAWDNSSSS